MRPFVVEPTHVDAILSVALNGPAGFEPPLGRGWQPPEAGELLGGPRECLNARNASPIGAALLGSCIAAVSRRRPAARRARRPGAPADPDRYRFTDLGPLLSAPESCKAIACLECQSCEHPAWPDSAARAFLGDLLWRLITTLPGYAEAPWEISAELLAARAAGPRARAA